MGGRSTPCKRWQPTQLSVSEKLAAPIEARRLRQFGAMANSAGSLDVTDGQDRLFPGERGLMRVANFRGEALAAMANHASPIPHVVGNGRVGAEGLRHGGIRRLGRVMP